MPQRRYTHATTRSGRFARSYQSPDASDFQPAIEGRARGDISGKALSFKGANIAVSCDDGAVHQLQTQVVTVSNAPLLGKNMLIVPEAKMDDGLLDVALYDGMSKFDLERHFLAIANGKRVDDPHISFRRTRRVRIVADQPLEANADLSVLAEQQVWEIEIVPRSVEVVVGKGSALTLPVEAAIAVPPLSGPQPPRDAGHRQRHSAA